MSTISAIFSALGNNSSVAQIAVKDGIETVGRTAMAYKEGSKTSKRFGALEARERLIEANATSLVWLGGIPTLKILFDKFYTNRKYGFAQFKEYGMDALAKTDVRLLDKNSPQALKLENIKDKALIPHVKKILGDTKGFKNTFIKRAAISTLIPIALVGYVLPKTVYAYTHNRIANQKKKELKNAFRNQSENKENIINSRPVFATFMGKAKRANLAFSGGIEKVSKYFTQPNTNMIMVDGGILAGRVGSSRNFLEGCERAISELGYVFFLYCGGKYIAKGLEFLTKNINGIPTSLDAKLLQDKSFTDAIAAIAKDKELVKKAVEFTANNEKDIINLIDANLKQNGGKFTNLTLQAANKLGLVHVVNGARNPFRYIETKEITALNGQIKEFVEALSKNANPEALIKKTQMLKRGSIIANIALCSVALAYGLPKLQYLFRSKVSPNTVAPGLAKYYDEENAGSKVNA